jgi:fatty acid desaturase
MPSFLYGDHKSHHLNQSYGTAGDAEYVFLGRRRTAWIFLLLSIVYPVLGPLRFSLMTPLALLVRPADRLIWQYASSLFILNPDYRREYDASAHSASRWVQEIACCVWAWCLIWSIWTRAIPMHAAIEIYFLFLFWIALNQLRALAAHRYGNAGSPWNYVGQVLDTNTFATGALLPELWAPVGMRYHALHHLMPSLPYHAAREAHRRLVERLPSGSPYHQTVQKGLWPPVKVALFGRRTID